MGEIVQSVHQELLQTLGRVEGLNAQHRGDVLTLNQVGGGQTSYRITYSRVMSREKAALAIADSNRAGSDQLIVTRKLGASAISELRAAGMSWVELSTGSVRLVGRGLLIDVVRPNPYRGGAPRESVRVRLRGRSGWIAETLLVWPAGRTIKLPELAAEAGVSAGLASRVLKRLADLGVVEVRGAGPHRTWVHVDRGGLLDLWAGEESVEPVTSVGVYLWSRTPRELLTKLVRIGEGDVLWALGGAAAANLHEPLLTVDPTPEVWIQSSFPAESIARQLGGSVVDQGANLHLQQSYQDYPLRHSIEATEVEGLRVVSPARAYVEAATGSGRAADVAQRLRKKVVDARG
ncbi:MAG: hypothetical protein C0504_03470 [Candidatus Solibacter sp.]|nr:hypothetical protein [Candidatus Solibacter sp.]